ARLAFGKRCARPAPRTRVGEHIDFVAINRARLTIGIPRTRHTVATSRRECRLQLRLRIAPGDGLLEPQRHRAAQMTLVIRNASTHMTKIQPVITVTHSPNPAR